MLGKAKALTVSKEVSGLPALSTVLAPVEAESALNAPAMPRRRPLRLSNKSGRV
jgi:hypothetical protein